MAPSTFASAAAGLPQSQNPTRDAASEWSRRTNGATQTFRRPSGAASIPTAPQQIENLAQQPPRYVPPHRNGTVPDTRYSKDQLLDLYKAQQGADGGLTDGLPDLFVGGWQPDVANGTSTWGRTEHNRDTQPGPDICWEKHAVIEPLGLVEMDDDERELFSTSVNTPIKPPASANKENQSANGLPTRKISVSGSASGGGGYGLPSPSVARGNPRRRETSESFPFPQNSTASPSAFNRDDQRATSPPPSLLRRRTDLKDLNKPEDRDKEVDEKVANPFGSLKRHPTGPLGGGFAAPSSPWSAGPQSAGIAPMGSFGSFGIAPQPGTTAEKRSSGLGGGRAESRFKNLLNKDSMEDSGGKTIESKASSSSLSRAHETDSWRKSDRADDVLDEADEDLPTGSAALSADAEVSPPHPRQGYRGFGTPSRQGTADEYGFSAFGMTSDASHGFGHGFLPGRDAFQQSPAHQRMGQSIAGGNEPMSPTDTNPYQSPEQHGVDRMAEDMEGDGSDMHNAPLPGLGAYGAEHAPSLGGLGSLGALPNLGRASGPQDPASDRSQTSSVGPNRGFAGLGGLGQLGAVGASAAWPVSQGGLGTPSRSTAGLSNAFGGGIFANHLGDLQSPSLAGLGSGILSPQAGHFGGSRMSSMFPPAMQDQMRPNDGRLGGRDTNDERSGGPFGNLGDAHQGTETPFANQGFHDRAGNQSQSGQSEESQPGQFGPPGQHAPKGSQHELGSAGPHMQQPQPGSSALNQPPPPQQRTMVMPDRMRWIYRDPQGQTQGPWSGLEMHDWYKAGFFSPELLVKKSEDPEYEPLAQLIRRIGNSREPFLVPQIGIPHGVPSSNGPNGWAGSSAGGSAQPPFASSFPSFGTTLTAEQQNALERRKQEEQYLMARQKEHLAQAQMAHRMNLQPGHGGFAPSQLHHHSSAHSLQSQPSFGSITSPTGYQPSPIQGPASGHASAHVPGFFDNSLRQQQPGGLGAVGAGVDSLGHIREEEIPGLMERLDLGNRADVGQYGAPGQPFAGQQQAPPSSSDPHSQRVQQMMQDRVRLQQEQADHDAAQSVQQEEAAANERLQQFEELQADDTKATIDSRFQSMSERRKVTQSTETARPRESTSTISTESDTMHADEQAKPQELLTLTEQVQKAASAKQTPAPQQPGLPHPFPPAPSQSPLPAPAAQRTGRQTVADQLQTESRERSQTPSLDTPSAAVAPWAKESVDAPKGPSLKEIQEAEARKAAEVEGLAASARRAAFQREMEVRAQAAVIQPGLPAGATWATGSPATPTSGSAPAAWAKAAPKPTGQSAAKSMAQIQKEEEARKKKLAAAVATASAQGSAMGGVVNPAGGKSYANLAGKVSIPPIAVNVGGGAWTTVGAGGKSKTPGPIPSPASRTVSASVVPTVQPGIVAAAASATIRKAPIRSSTMTTSGGINAQDEFRKWAVNELRPDLNKGISADDFVASLVFLPPEADIVTEAVHGVSSTIDSRHFAEEFIRRKKLADKGIVDSTVPPKSVSPYSGGDSKSGGWSEVAKKGPGKEPTKEEANGNFRVVAAKKKGGKR